MSLSKNLLKELFFFTVSLFVFCASGCRAEILLKANKTGGVEIQFKAGAGSALETMLNNATDENSVFYDKNQLKSSFSAEGFSNIQIKSSSISDFSFSMDDSAGRSFLFSSGIIQNLNGKIKIHLSPEKLSELYSQSDEQLQMLLDLFLAPVFNDEKMTETEYLEEVIKPFYGNKIADEMKNSIIRLTVVNSDGSKKEHNLPLCEIVTISSDIQL